MQLAAVYAAAAANANATAQTVIATAQELLKKSQTAGLKLVLTKKQRYRKGGKEYENKA